MFNLFNLSIGGKAFTQHMKNLELANFGTESCGQGEFVLVPYERAPHEVIDTILEHLSYDIQDVINEVHKKVRLSYRT